jgi:uncharacterized protein DUF4203
VSSLVLAGLSSPFASLFEGVGCFLGGFCLSMWFLTLKDDGITQSKAGKTIITAVLSLSIGALGFTRYTRNRTLLVCNSFSGATAIALGIDCFTRGGYKEFWIFVWGKYPIGFINLAMTDVKGFNMNIFPLNTNSYPVTRSIRVESSCIIVIFLVAVVINMKLWKRLQKHLEEQSEERAKNIAKRERAELESGKATELRVAKERELWEKIYGEPPRNTPLANSSVPQSIYSIKHSSTKSAKRPTSEVNTLDMLEMDMANDTSMPMKVMSKRLSEGAGIIINVEEAQDIDEIKPVEPKGRPVSHMPAQKPTKTEDTRHGPIVTPLTFSPKPPDCPPPEKEDSGQDEASDDGTVSSLEANLDDLDKRSDSGIPTLSSSPPFSNPRVSKAIKEPISSIHEPKEKKIPESNGREDSQEDLESVSTSRQTTLDDFLRLTQENRNHESPKPGKEIKDTESKGLRSTHSTTESTAAETESNTQPVQSKLEPTELSFDNIKEKTSQKAMRAFKRHKTFEWAKQSTLADTPPLEEISRPSSPGVVPEINTENPAELKDLLKIVTDVENSESQGISPRLEQTESPATMAPTGLSESLGKQSPQKSVTNLTTTLQSNLTQNDPSKLTPRQRLLSPGSSRAAISPTRGSLHSPIESPIEEDTEKEKAAEDGKEMPLASDPLSEVKEELPSKRLSSAGFPGVPIRAFTQPLPENYSSRRMDRTLSTQSVSKTWSPAPTGLTSPSHVKLEESSVPPSRQGLARRSSNLQYEHGNISSQSSIGQHHQSAQSMYGTNGMRQSFTNMSSMDTPVYNSSARSSVYLPELQSQRLSQQNLTNHFDSHQPQRGIIHTVDQQAARQASWRASLQHDVSTRRHSAGLLFHNDIQSASALDVHRQAMIQEKRMMDQARTQQGAEDTVMGHHIAETMRRPDGIALHAKRLSALQRQVKMD